MAWDRLKLMAALIVLALLALVGSGALRGPRTIVADP